MRDNTTYTPADPFGEASILLMLARDYRKAREPEAAADCERRAAQYMAAAQPKEPPPSVAGEIIAGIGMFATFAALVGAWIATSPGML